MGNWLVRERRGIGWRDQALASISAPPAPLMVLFGVVFVLLYFATFSEYRARMERSLVGFKLLLFLSPLLLILVVHVMMLMERWFSNIRASRLFGQDQGGFPWSLALMLVLLLVLVYYHSIIKSSWFHPV